MPYYPDDYYYGIESYSGQDNVYSSDHEKLWEEYCQLLS